MLDITLMQCAAKVANHMTSSRNPDSRKRRVTALLEEEQITELEAIADRNRVSLAWVVRDAVAAYLTGQRSPLRASADVRPGSD
ncbi:CopG family transcriptional regulator [Blastomonas sp.]|uniref:ribbon-helix-helix domain-containing protein n=1 Tax=Blastomonas sp. TaxID=1909299 RepID=UPI00359397C5